MSNTSNQSNTSGGGFRVLHLDGTTEMAILFPDQATFQDWASRTGHIKAVAETLFTHLEAVEHQHDCMSQEHQQEGVKWLQLIADLCAMGFGVPPSIAASETQWLQIRAGTFEMEQ